MLTAKHYADAYGFVPNASNYVCAPPCDAGDCVDLILEGTMVAEVSPYGYQIKLGVDPNKWDWSDQTGVRISYWRKSRHEILT